MATIDNLKTQAGLIGNATAVGENTAKRVGDTFGMAAELIEENAIGIQQLNKTVVKKLDKNGLPVNDGSYQLNRTINLEDGKNIELTGSIIVNNIFKITKSASITYTDKLSVFDDAYVRYYGADDAYYGSSYNNNVTYCIVGLVRKGTASFTDEELIGNTITVNGVTVELGKTDLAYITPGELDARINAINDNLSNIPASNVKTHGAIDYNKVFPLHFRIGNGWRYNQGYIFDALSTDRNITKVYIKSVTAEVASIAIYNPNTGVFSNTKTYTLNVGELNSFDADILLPAGCVLALGDAEGVGGTWDQTPYKGYESCCYFYIGVGFSNYGALGYWFEVKEGDLNIKQYVDEQNSDIDARIKSIAECLVENIPSATVKTLSAGNINWELVEDTGFSDRCYTTDFLPLTKKPTYRAEYTGTKNILINTAIRYANSDGYGIGEGTYSSDCTQAKFVFIFQSDVDLEDVKKNLSITLDGVKYTFDAKFVPVATVAERIVDEKIKELAPTGVATYNDNFLQIFKSVVCLGDSLTAGFTAVDDVMMGSANARTEKLNYPGFLEKRTGNVWKNIAIGSSTCHHWRYLDGPTVDYKPNIEEANIHTDLYTIALGANDNRTSFAIGTAADINDADAESNGDTFYGNYDYVVRKLHGYNPNAHIILFTMSQIEGGSADKYNEAIRYIAEKYDYCHLLDLWNIADFNSAFLRSCWKSAHFTPIGYNRVSSLMEFYINKMMAENLSSFIKAPYYNGYPNRI